MRGKRRIRPSIAAEAVTAANLDAYQARKKAGIVRPEPERIITPATCWACHSDRHEDCDGGAWDIERLPVPCVCSMEDHTPHWSAA